MSPKGVSAHRPPTPGYPRWRIPRVGGFNEGGLNMSKEKMKSIPEEQQMTPASDMRLVFIPLRQLPDPGKTLDEFSNRFPEKYREENLEDLVESIKIHKLKDPLHIVKARDDFIEIISGHRRLASLYINVRRN